MVLSKYADELSPENKRRYIEKLKLIDNIDPYTLRASDFQEDVNLPQITLKSILEYLIFNISPFTQEEMRAIKSLDAYVQMVCKWIQEVKKKVIGNHIVVIGKVRHSQRLNESPLKPWIVLDQHGKIQSAHCNCIAGLGEVCTHVATVLFSLQQEMQSVTDKLAYWIEPGKKELHLAVNEIDFNSPQKLLKNEHIVKSTDEAEKNAKMSRNDVIKFLKEYKEAGHMSVLHRIVKPFSEEKKNFPNIFSKHNELLSLEELQQMGESISFDIDTALCQQIEKATRKQSKSGKWFYYRKGRITASNFKAACTTNITDPSISLINKICYPRNINFKAGLYGCEHEKNALKDYIETHKKCIQPRD